jgi:nucleoside-diphosphate-sugar epimerase
VHVLVTGGSGFIGSHLCAALLAQGHRVTCVDNLSTGSARNVESLLSHRDFILLQHDVVQPLPDDVAPDVIFHLASPASVPDYLARPLETLAVNSDGTRAMLELARRHHAKFLFTSTSEIYGNPLVHPQPETYWGNVGTLGPRACYDEGKRFGEALVMAYVRVHEVDARIVRIFNTYGPHSRPDDGRIVPNFVMQALRNEPITIYGDGSQTRSFCYVSDMVQGLLSAMFSAGTRGEVFNLGNPDEYTVREFAQQIARHLGSVAGMIYCPLPVDDPTRRCPDISKARRVLGWEPTTDLETGMDQTIRWFRDVGSAMAPAV